MIEWLCTMIDNIHYGCYVIHSLITYILILYQLKLTSLLHVTIEPYKGKLMVEANISEFY